MKKLLISALALMPAVAIYAQGPVDAMTLSQTELRGTARFMSMGGAFTALGSDLSALSQNPAGIGVYRGSDIGLTLGIDINSDKAAWTGGSNTETTTLANLNSAGYVGTALFGDNGQNSISWGFSYNRLFRFNRSYRGGMSNMNTSLSNYIASITDGCDPKDLWETSSTGSQLYPYDNYKSDAPDWLSVLFYNAGMINADVYVDNYNDVFESNTYRGLWQHGYVDDNGNKVNPSTGSAQFRIRERGHADEYNLTLGGGVMNVLYWGIGLGITSLDYTQEYSYDETISNALVPEYPAGYMLGEANRAELLSYKKLTGTGVNFKIGAIIKPINELRIGLAIHTPTYYSLSSSSYGDAFSRFSANVPGYSFSSDNGTPWDEYDYQLNTPWKLTAGIAGVIGGRAILSLDYQYDAYNDMKMKYDGGAPMDYNNDNIGRYYKGTSTIRVGAEFRVTPRLSVRAGFNNSTSAAGTEFKNANTEGSYMTVSTAGQNPSYQVNNSTRYITLGLGYKVKGFYVDLAYVNRHNSSTINAFTPFVDYDYLWSNAPSAELTSNSSQIVATVGYRF